MPFDTHLLTMEEVWYVREHMANLVSVRTIKLVREVELLELELENKQKLLEEQVAILNKRRMRDWRDK